VGAAGQSTESKRLHSLKPFALGVVDTIHSQRLAETRVLNIYLPEGYSPDSAATYPVIYLLDGSADEDFIHVIGLVQYCTFPWIHQIPKSIVVGIANVNRKRDFTYPPAGWDFLTPMGYKQSDFPAYGGSGKFMAFVGQELQPYIDRHYKTNGARMIIGQSLAGLEAAEMLLKQPQLFDTYIIMSPSTWWDGGSLLDKAADYIKAFPKTKKRIYVGVGNEGNVMVGGAEKLVQLLKQYGGDNLQVQYDYLPAETHATMTHQAVYNAFRWLH
jgi:hypothetical protein